MHNSMLLSLLDDVSETMALTKKRCVAFPATVEECRQVIKTGAHELLVVTRELLWFNQLRFTMDSKSIVIASRSAHE